jgi:hypothetical protein
MVAPFCAFGSRVRDVLEKGVSIDLDSALSRATALPSRTPATSGMCFGRSMMRQFRDRDVPVIRG